VNVVCLTQSDLRLLTARFAEHGNSHRRMRSAMQEAGALPAAARLEALRGLEKQFQIDLGSVCHRFGRRNLPETHAIERWVMNYITEVRRREGAEDELWVRLDRVAEIRELMEGRLVGEPES
jgi:hypothetical protein